MVAKAEESTVQLMEPWRRFMQWGDRTGGDGGMGNNFQKGGAEVNNDGLKKKHHRHGRNKSLSRKKYRRDAKTVSSNAVKATFIHPLKKGTTLSGTDASNATINQY